MKKSGKKPAFMIVWKRRKFEDILPRLWWVDVARRMSGRTIEVCDQPILWEMVHYDAQLIGGSLHERHIAEMATGRAKPWFRRSIIFKRLIGKELPTCYRKWLSCKTGFSLMVPYLNFGSNGGCIQNSMPVAERREMIRKILLMELRLFGFDYSWYRHGYLWRTRAERPLPVLSMRRIRFCWWGRDPDYIQICGGSSLLHGNGRWWWSFWWT